MNKNHAIFALIIILTASLAYIVGSSNGSQPAYPDASQRPAVTKAPPTATSSPGLRMAEVGPVDPTIRAEREKAKDRCDDQYNTIKTISRQSKSLLDVGDYEKAVRQYRLDCLSIPSGHVENMLAGHPQFSAKNLDSETFTSRYDPNKRESCIIAENGGQMGLLCLNDIGQFRFEKGIARFYDLSNPNDLLRNK